MSLGRWDHVTSEFGGEYARHLVRSDCQLEFATRENNFHFLSCLDLRRKMVQTWKLFGYGRAKFIAWFCYFFFKNLSTTLWKKGLSMKNTKSGKRTHRFCTIWWWPMRWNGQALLYNGYLTLQSKCMRILTARVWSSLDRSDRRT